MQLLAFYVAIVLRCYCVFGANNDELSEIKQSLASLKHSVEIMKKENVELKDEIKLMKAQNISGHLQPHMSLSRSGKRQATRQVAFTVAISAPDLINLGQYQTIIFDHAISNLGNAYDTSSGIFLAPVSGTYSFTLTLSVFSFEISYVQIVRDGVEINDIYAGSTDHTILSTTKQWIFEVNKGSEVWIRASHTGTNVHGYMHTLLSGFLLYPTE